MIGGGETSSSKASSGEAGWDSLKDVKFNQPYSIAEREVTAGSVVDSFRQNLNLKMQQHSTQNAAGKTERKLELFNEQLNAKNEQMHDRESAFIDATTGQREANYNVSKAEDNRNDFRQAISDNKDTILNLREETKIGKYAKNQAEQIGAILKADSQVVKNALNSFVKNILYKMPIRLTSYEDIANGSAKYKEDANNSREVAASAKESLANSKQQRTEQINQLRANRTERREKRKELATERSDLKVNKGLLRQAEYDLSEANKEKAKADKNVERAQGELASATEIAKSAKEKRDAVAEKVGQLTEKQEKLEAMIAFRKELGSRSPSAIRNNLEKEISSQERAQEADRFIWGKTGVSAEDIDEAIRLKYGTALEDARERLAALDTYENLRAEQYSNIRKSETANKGISGAFSGLKKKIATSMAALF